ncbi:MAG: hypothetical protein ACP5KN_11325, partial [Armatimonadota bacterium]
MRLLERFTWLHVLIISLIGAGLVGAIVHFTRPGAFTATSSLLLSDRPDIVAGIGGDSSAADSGPSLERLQAILVSRALRERVAEKVKLAETLNARRVDAVEMLLHNTTVKAIGEDGLTMTVTTHGYARPRFAMLGYPVTFERARQLSAEIANAYVSELREYLRDVSLQHAADTVSFLRTRRDELQGELAETEDRLQTLRAQYELLDPDNEATRLGERIRALEQARAEAAAEADASASSMKEAESQLAEADARRIASAVEARNPVISRLEEELTQHRIDLAAELARGKT